MSQPQVLDCTFCNTNQVKTIHFKECTGLPDFLQFSRFGDVHAKQFYTLFVAFVKGLSIPVTKSPNTPVYECPFCRIVRLKRCPADMFQHVATCPVALHIYGYDDWYRKINGRTRKDIVLKWISDRIPHLRKVAIEKGTWCVFQLDDPVYFYMHRNHTVPLPVCDLGRPDLRPHPLAPNVRDFNPNAEYVPAPRIHGKYLPEKQVLHYRKTGQLSASREGRVQISTREALQADQPAVKEGETLDRSVKSLSVTIPAMKVGPVVHVSEKLIPRTHVKKPLNVMTGHSATTSKQAASGEDDFRFPKLLPTGSSVMSTSEFVVLLLQSKVSQIPTSAAYKIMEMLHHYETAASLSAEATLPGTAIDLNEPVGISFQSTLPDTTKEEVTSTPYLVKSESKASLDHICPCEFGLDSGAKFPKSKAQQTVSSGKRDAEPSFGVQEKHTLQHIKTEETVRPIVEENHIQMANDGFSPIGKRKRDVSSEDSTPAKRKRGRLNKQDFTVSHDSFGRL